MLSQEQELLAKKIWNDSVPKSGQSLTVEGELIRCIEKLRDEAQRNGNGNFDSGHQLMLFYIAENILNEVSLKGFERERVTTILESLLNFERVTIDDEPYDYLTSMVVDLYRTYGSRARLRNPILQR